MKLQKNINRTNGTITWYRYKLDLPSKQVESLGWNKADVIEVTVLGTKLLLSNKTKQGDKQ